MAGNNMVSEAKAAANARFDRKTYDYITVKVRKDSKKKMIYQDYADSLDIPLSVFVQKALDYVIENKIKL